MNWVRTSLSLAAAAALAWGAAATAAEKPNPHAALDCGYCHQDTPRFGVDTVDTVNFWNAEGDEPRLCERCHRTQANLHPLGVVPDPSHLGTRTPAHLPLGKSAAVRGKVVCISCHFVHAADADRALLRGFPGSDQPGLFRTWQELCRECHGEGLEKRSPHAGDDRACAFCHSVRPEPGQKTAITPGGERLCKFCHGPKSASHYAGVNPFGEGKDCVGCHNPHLGKDHPARLKEGYFDSIREAVTLNPHRKRTLCFACHADESSGSLREASPVALCQRCHGSGTIPGMSHPMNAVPAGFTIPEGWPLSGGALTCLTCHVPGHVPGALSGRPAEPAGAVQLLRGGEPQKRTAVCFRCHTRQQWAGRNPHQEAALKNAGCTFCHERQPVRGQDRPETMKFVADITILCLSCHDPGDHPAGTRHTVTLTRAMPAVPKDLPVGTGNRVTCATCHDSHVDPVRYRQSATERSAFCLRCHKL
jgi:predicted CXXCH cytochrome family protein